jgi:DNA primase
MNASEVDFIRFKTDLLLKESGNDPVKRAALIKDIISSVSVIPDPIVRSAYIKDCSQLLDEKEQVLINEILKLRRNKRPRVANDASKYNLRDASSRNETYENEPDAASPEEHADENQTDVTALRAQGAFFPFKRYEPLLIKYIIKYGEYVICEVEEESEDGPVKTAVTVAEYIQYELFEDDINFQIPVYRQILEEAIENCKSEGFVASDYFLTHHDLEISKVASEALSDKYHLSKMFDAKEDITARISMTDEDIEKEKAERKRQELQRNIVNDIFTMKYAYIKQKIEEINKQIKSLQSDEEKVTGLLRQRMNLDMIKNRLGKELGERIIVGV